MTRLELLIKVFSEFSGKTERELADWADINMSEETREKLATTIPGSDVEALLAEFRSNPSAVMAAISGHLSAPEGEPN